MPGGAAASGIRPNSVMAQPLRSDGQAAGGDAGEPGHLRLQRCLSQLFGTPQRPAPVQTDVQLQEDVTCAGTAGPSTVAARRGGSPDAGDGSNWAQRFAGGRTVIGVTPPPAAEAADAEQVVSGATTANAAVGARSGPRVRLKRKAAVAATSEQRPAATAAAVSGTSEEDGDEEVFDPEPKRLKGETATAHGPAGKPPKGASALHTLNSLQQ